MCYSETKPRATVAGPIHRDTCLLQITKGQGYLVRYPARWQGEPVNARCGNWMVRLPSLRTPRSSFGRFARRHPVATSGTFAACRPTRSLSTSIRWSSARPSRAIPHPVRRPPASRSSSTGSFRHLHRPRPRRDDQLRSVGVSDLRERRAGLPGAHLHRAGGDGAGPGHRPTNRCVHPASTPGDGVRAVPGTARIALTRYSSRWMKRCTSDTSRVRSITWPPLLFEPVDVFPSIAWKVFPFTVHFTNRPMWLKGPGASGKS
jgi:hypothetical protein